MVPRIPDIEMINMPQKYPENGSIVKVLPTDVKKGLPELNDVMRGIRNFECNE